MRETRHIMGMPVIIELVGAPLSAFERLFDYFIGVDERFSTYKSESEISRINRKEIPPDAYSREMQEIFRLAKETERDTNGYFSIVRPDGTIDPSGIVKGWAINNAAKLAEELGYQNYYIDAGGDIQSKGLDAEGKPWTIGIRNPFNREEIVKVIAPEGRGIATSGTAVRGQHIYNPHAPGQALEEVASITIVGPNVYEADRFATAAFAMGAKGIHFIEQLPGFEGYSIDRGGIATMTRGFNALLAS